MFKRWRAGDCIDGTLAAYGQCGDDICIIKPGICAPWLLRPVAANEIICHRLIERLQQAGVNAVTAKCVEGIGYCPGNCPESWFVAALEKLTVQGRLRKDLKTDREWPGWVYWFDRWISRLDGDAETNLLLVSECASVVPVDYGVVFSWASAGPRNLIKRVDDFDVPCRAEIVTASAKEKDVTLSAIKAITDEELWVIVTENVDLSMIAPSTLTAYWAGLCLRRNLL